MFVMNEQLIMIERCLLLLKPFLPTSSRLTQELKVRTVIGILSCDKAGTEFAMQ